MRVFNNLFDYFKHVRERPEIMLGGAVSYTRLSCYINGYKYFELYDDFLKHNENNDQPEMRNRPEWYI